MIVFGHPFSRFVALVACVATAFAMEFPLQWEFRLGGGTTALSGRVEMRPNATAPWGTICKDLFKENNFGAIAACNSAGLVGVTQALYKTDFGPGTGPIYLTNVACTANTTFIQNCSRSPLLQTGACVHFEDVGVECSPPESFWQFKMVNGTAPSNGLVLIQPMPGLPWGALSNAQFLAEGWRLNRRLLCNSLGYLNVAAPGSGDPTRSLYNADPSLARYVVFGACPATAATIGTCPYSNFGSVNFPASTFLVLDCAPPAPALLPAGVEVSLANGVTPWSGAILIRPNASLPWGVLPRDEVSSLNWFTLPPVYSQPLTSAQQAVLNAVCHSAGFPSATKAIYGKYGMFTSVPTTDSGGQNIVYYQAFNCSGGAGAFNLTDCIAGPNAYTNSGNSPDDYAGVDCFPDPPPYDQWEYRLNTNGGIAANGTGYVEMRPNAGSPWLGICGDSPPLIDGLCRKLGFGGMGSPSLSYASSLPLLGRKQYYIGFRPSCPRKESPFWELPDNMGLENCTLSPVGMHTCYANGDVKLNCLFPKIEEMTVRVSDGGAPWRGRVDILPRAGAGYEWGSITDGTYGNMAVMSNVYLAFAICRKLGFTGPNVTNPVINVGVFPSLPHTAPIFWKSPICRVDSIYLENCTYGQDNYGERGDFPHVYDMGVDCFPSPFEPRVVLEGAGAGKGRVMFQYNPNIPFGSVCNDLFKHNHFAWNAACRSAGYLNVTRAAYQSFGPAAASAPIALDDVICTEGNQFLQNCTHNLYGQHNCHHGEDAGVDCYPPPEVTSPWEFRLSDGTAATNGRVEMRPGPAFPWGSICAGPYFNHTVAAWEAACRSVGFTNVTQARWRYFGKGSDTVYLDNVSCGVGSLTLVDCDRFPLGSYRCNPSEVAGIDCDAPAESRQLWQFRLVDGWTTTSGRLEMRPHPATAWGGVCRRGLQHFEALRTVCRSTGHAAATRPVLFRPLGPSPAIMMPITQPFYLDDAICNHTTPYLSNCSYAPLYSHDCDPLTDALYIECMPTLTTAPTATHKTDSHSSSASASRQPPSPSATLSRTVLRTGTVAAPQTPTGGWPKRARTVTASTSTTATTWGTATATPHSLSGSRVSFSTTHIASASAPPATLSRGPSSVSQTAQGTPSGRPTANTPSRSRMLTTFLTRTTPNTQNRTQTPTAAPTELPPATNGSAACPASLAAPRMEAGTSVVAARGPHVIELRLPLPVLAATDAVFVVPLPPQLPPGALAQDTGITCWAAAAGLLRCELTVLDEKAVSTAVTMTFALQPTLSAPGCAGLADVRVSVTLLPVSSDPSLAVVALLTAAAGTTRLVFLADPTAFDSMAVVVALVSRCATANDAAMARWARYLLSPLIDLGPSVVGLVHTLVPVGIVLLHAAAVVVSARLRRSHARHAHQLDHEDRDELLVDSSVAAHTTTATQPPPKASTMGTASRWRFPGASMAVAVLLYPGAAWALATHVRHVSDRNGSTPAPVSGQVALLCAFLVSVPVVASFCLIRIDVLSAFHAYPTPEQQPLTSTTGRIKATLRWACCPRGLWGPEASWRSFGPLHGITVGRRPAARWALLAGACAVLLLVCALIGAPARADTCQGLHAGAAIIVCVGTAALTLCGTLATPNGFFATPLTAALTAAGGLSLGALLAAQAAGSSDAIKAAAVVTNAAIGILRSLHSAGTFLWLAPSAFSNALSPPPTNDFRRRSGSGST